MTRLVVRLLGGFRVEVDGEAVYGFETDKARALFTYLIVEADRPHRRETLASLLWPERPDTIARANLRQALVRVRRALGDYLPPSGGASRTTSRLPISGGPAGPRLFLRRTYRRAVQCRQRLLA